MRVPQMLGAIVVAAAMALVPPDEAAGKSATENPISAIAADAEGVWAWLNTYELVRLDPRTNRATARIPTLPALITDLAVDEGGVWGSGRCGLANCRYGILMRFDPRTGRRSRPLTRLGLHPRGVAAGYGSVWVLGGRRVLRIDPRTRRLAGTPIPIGRDAQDIAVGAGGVWVATGERPGPTGAPLCDLVGIDPRSLRVFRRQPIDCGPGKRIDAGPRDIWSTGSSGTRGLTRVRARGPRLPLRGVQLPGESTDVATGLGRIWVTGVRDTVAGRYGERRGEAVLSAVDPAAGTAGAPLPLGDALSWLPRVAVGAGAVWVANTPTGTITRVDPASGAVVARVGLDRPPVMRASCTAVAAALARVAAPTHRRSQGGARSCAPIPARAAAGLPAPVVVVAGGPPRCAARVRPDGRVHRTGWRPFLRLPAGSVLFPLSTPELAVLSRRGRIVIVPARGGPAIWRSTNRYRQLGAGPSVTGVAVFEDRVAISVFAEAGAEARARLLIAREGGAEREVLGVRGEAPVGWTAAGELVTREGSGTLRLRGPGGELSRTLVRGADAFDWDPGSRTAVVADGGSLRRVGSGPEVTLAGLRALGVGGREPGPNVDVADRGRIVLVGRRALVVLRADGSLWARADFPRGGEIAGQGSLTTSSPDRRAIAFANVRHRAGVMSVELLREGDRRARRLLRRAFVARPPGWSTGLDWRGRWLLSWSTDGAVTALRTGTHERVRLDSVGRVLAVRRGPQATGIFARWEDP